MKRLKRQDTYLALIFTMIFVFAFSSIGYAVSSPPDSDPNGPYIGTAGISVAFDGTGSSDPDGDPLTYAWDFGDGNTGIGPTPTHTYAAMGLYTVTLIVDDGVGSSDSDTTTATISNALPVCNADGPYNGTVGSPVLLDGSGSFDPDGIIILFEWDFESDGVYDWSSPTTGNTTHTYVSAGFFTATLRVTDDAGDADSCTTTAEIQVVLPPCDPEPLTQGYWHRQCLGVPASEGGLDPGRNGRGPSKVKEPNFVDVLMPAADAVLEDKLFIFNSCSEGMDADPPSSKCERAIKQYTALVFNQLSDRVSNSCEVDLSPWGCVSTNVGDLIDELAALINSGDPYNCKLAADCAALVNEGEGLEIPGIELNEIRIDQPSTDIDEYCELIGPAGMTLNGLTYLVIGDGAGGTSGVIEAVIELSGNSIPSSGFFVAAEDTFTLGSADLTANLNFENSDNVTHMIVSNFSGSNGDDLDTNDDGVLDVTPWSEIVDCVALIETVDSGEKVYCSITVGPDSSYVPGHVYQCPSSWVIGPFGPSGADDTPGAANNCI